MQHSLTYMKSELSQQNPLPENCVTLHIMQLNVEIGKTMDSQWMLNKPLQCYQKFWAAMGITNAIARLFCGERHATCKYTSLRDNCVRPLVSSANSFAFTIDC